MSSHALTKPRKGQSKCIDPTFLYILSSNKFSAFDHVSKYKKESVNTTEKNSDYANLKQHT